MNPGVIFNDDPKCHIKNFKPLPLIPLDAKSPAAKVNRCIECGFCEVNCLSCGFTLSSRQRIVLQREIARLRQNGDAPERLALLEKQYLYPGNRTCAGDGLCSMSCPMGINTGDLTHIIRQEELPQGSLGYKAGNFAANHFAGIKSALRPILGLADLGHSILGTKAMSSITKGMHNALGIPLWTPAMPKPYKFKPKELKAGNMQIPPDRIVAGTYLCAAAATRGRSRSPIQPEGELDAFLEVYGKMGGQYNRRSGKLIADGSGTAFPVPFLETIRIRGFPQIFSLLSWQY